MYHKESGTGNDPFLAGNMLCRRRSLSPLRISALINLLRLFSIRERERLIISADDALPGKFPEHTLHSQAATVSRYRARCYWEKSMRPYESRTLPETRQETREDHCYCGIRASESIEFR